MKFQILVIVQMLLRPFNTSLRLFLRTSMFSPTQPLILGVPFPHPTSYTCISCFQNISLPLWHLESWAIWSSCPNLPYHQDLIHVTHSPRAFADICNRYWSPSSPHICNSLSQFMPLSALLQWCKEILHEFNNCEHICFHHTTKLNIQYHTKYLWSYVQSAYLELWPGGCPFLC